MIHSHRQHHHPPALHLPAPLHTIGRTVLSGSCANSSWAHCTTVNLEAGRAQVVIWTNATVPALKGNDDDAVTQTAGGKRDGMAFEARDESKGKEMTEGAAQILNQG